MITRPAGAGLSSLTTLATFKALGADSRREIRDLAASFASTRRTVPAPLLSLLACWCRRPETASNGILQAIMIHNTLSVSVRTSVYTLVIVHPLHDREDS